jgi:hypothetical protein
LLQSINPHGNFALLPLLDNPSYPQRELQWISFSAGHDRAGGCSVDARRLAGPV